LFYGNGLITPAISVLSAVEGLKTAASALEPCVVPIAALVWLRSTAYRRQAVLAVG
jgi:KUP system potassium uptake protein